MAKSLNELLVMIIDDQVTHQRSVQEFLMLLGFSKFILSYSGKEAFGKYLDQEMEIDLIICDILMPDVSGIELFDMILESRRNNNVLRFIFCSALDTPDIIIKIGGIVKKHKDKQLSFGYIVKPLTPRSLNFKIFDSFSDNPDIMKIFKAKDKKTEIIGNNPDNQISYYVSILNKITISGSYDDEGFENLKSKVQKILSVVDYKIILFSLKNLSNDLITKITFARLLIELCALKGKRICFEGMPKEFIDSFKEKYPKLKIECDKCEYSRVCEFINNPKYDDDPIEKLIPQKVEKTVEDIYEQQAKKVIHRSLTTNEIAFIGEIIHSKVVSAIIYILKKNLSQTNYNTILFNMRDIESPMEKKVLLFSSIIDLCNSLGKNVCFVGITEAVKQYFQQENLTHLLKIGDCSICDSAESCKNVSFKRKDLSNTHLGENQTFFT